MGYDRLLEQEWRADAWKDSSGRREKEIAAENAAEAAIDKEEAADEIGSYYRDTLLSKKDIDAFDLTAAAFGFVRTVRALKNISKRAKEKDDAYWARRARR